MEALHVGKIREIWEQIVINANEMAHTFTELDLELTKSKGSLAKKKLLEHRRLVKEFDDKFDTLRKANNIY